VSELPTGDIVQQILSTAKDYRWKLPHGSQSSLECRQPCLGDWPRDVWQPTKHHRQDLRGRRRHTLGWMERISG